MANKSEVTIRDLTPEELDEEVRKVLANERIEILIDLGGVSCALGRLSSVTVLTDYELWSSLGRILGDNYSRNKPFQAFDIKSFGVSRTYCSTRPFFVLSVILGKQKTELNL